jgi:hypothetical protein
MNEDSMFVMMIANLSVGTRRITTTMSILLILIVIVLGVNTWLMWRIISMGNGVQTDPSTKPPAHSCQASGVQVKQQ